MPNIGQIVEQMSLGSLVESLGVAISNAQFAMDQNSITLLERMSTDKITIVEGGKPVERTLLSLGFAPSFFHISEATIDARVAFSMTESHSLDAKSSARAGTAFSLFAANISASYTNKYSFHAEGSSSISAKFVSVPPPAELKEFLASMRK